MRQHFYEKRTFLSSLEGQLVTLRAGSEFRGASALDELSRAKGNFYSCPEVVFPYGLPSRSVVEADPMRK
jgi:hypothetical protein